MSYYSESDPLPSDPTDQPTTTTTNAGDNAALRTSSGATSTPKISTSSIQPQQKPQQQPQLQQEKPCTIL